MKIDYSKIGLKVGIEWHQRLDTHKLFCNCPSIIGEYPVKDRIVRKIRASRSELGEFDPAALVEHKRSREFLYDYNPDNVCLVELDETPPYPFNEEALEIALTVAMLLKMQPVDEIRCMRKTVIDGSNTTGFQRTMLVAVGTEESIVDTDEGPVRLRTLCLEEESAFIVETQETYAEYRLDRLGIPLIELATEPDIKTPTQAKFVAQRIGAIFRATGRVQRGIGSIRQDLNISIKGGARQEIKGVQELELIPKIIEIEVMRQLNLLKIRELLNSRSKPPIPINIIDVTDVFSNTQSKIISKALRGGGVVYSLKLPGFRGLLGMLIQESRTFGGELADYARVWGGLKGLFHSDELPAYGISSEELEEVMRLNSCEELDAVVIVAGDKRRCRAALEAVAKRAELAFHTVPGETRRALPDGCTSYLRPLPGAARMYPETDIPPIVITRELLERISTNLPPLPEDLIEMLVSEGLNRHLAEQMAFSPMLPLYRAIRERSSADSRIVASTLLNLFPYLRREGYDPLKIPTSTLIEVFNFYASGRILKEHIEEILTELSRDPKLPLEKLIKEKTSSMVDEETVRSLIRRVIKDNSELVEEKGEKAVRPLMGIVMSELRGKVKGAVVYKLLQEELKSKI